MLEYLRKAEKHIVDNCNLIQSQLANGYYQTTVEM